MKTIKYKVALLSLAIFSSSSLLAQDNEHEFSVWGAGGLSTLKYKTSFGKQENGMGGAFGLGYTYFFNNNWGLGTGLEMSLFQAKTKLSGFKDNYPILDVIENEDATLYIDANNYTEKQQLMTINIPLMLQYQTGNTHKFYAALGGKVAFPVSKKYKVSDATYDVYAYYPRTNQMLYDPMYPAGYGTHNGVSEKDDLEFKTAFIASAEAGVKWKLGDNLSLYTGAYFDYGLNNIDKNSKDKRVIEYKRDNPISLKSNSIMQSQDINGNAFVNKVRPMAVGLKVKLAFGFGKRSPRRVFDEAIIPSRVSVAEEEARQKAADEARLAADRARQAEAERLRREREAEEALAAAKKKAEYEQAKLDVAFTLHNFQLGEAAITPEIKKVLDRSIGVLKAHPELKIYSTGYTCDKGTEAINMKVSEQRAKSVKAYMIKAGISADRIVTRAEGEKNPAYPNTNEANRKLNRRVEVVAHE